MFLSDSEGTRQLENKRWKLEEETWEKEEESWEKDALYSQTH